MSSAPSSAWEMSSTPSFATERSSKPSSDFQRSSKPSSDFQRSSKSSSDFQRSSKPGSSLPKAYQPLDRSYISDLPLHPSDMYSQARFGNIKREVLGHNTNQIEPPAVHDAPWRPKPVQSEVTTEDVPSLPAGFSSELEQTSSSFSSWIAQPIVPSNPFHSQPNIPYNQFKPTVPSNPFETQPTSPSNPFKTQPTSPSNLFKTQPTSPSNLFKTQPTSPSNPFKTQPTSPSNPFKTQPTSPSNLFKTQPTSPSNLKSNSFERVPSSSVKSSNSISQINNITPFQNSGLWDEWKIDSAHLDITENNLPAQVENPTTTIQKLSLQDNQSKLSYEEHGFNKKESTVSSVSISKGRTRGTDAPDQETTSWNSEITLSRPSQDSTSWSTSSSSARGNKKDHWSPNAEKEIWTPNSEILSSSTSPEISSTSPRAEITSWISSTDSSLESNPTDIGTWAYTSSSELIPESFDASIEISSLDSKPVSEDLTDSHETPDIYTESSIDTLSPPNTEEVFNDETTTLASDGTDHEPRGIGIHKRPTHKRESFIPK